MDSGSASCYLKTGLNLRPMGVLCIPLRGTLPACPVLLGYIRLGSRGGGESVDLTVCVCPACFMRDACR